MAGEQDPNVRYVGSEADQAAVGEAFHRRPDQVPIGASLPRSGSSIFFGGTDVYSTGPGAAFFEKLPVERRGTDVGQLKVGDLSVQRAWEILQAIQNVLDCENRREEIANIALIRNPFRPNETKETLTNLVDVTLRTLPEGSTLQLTRAIGAAVLLVMIQR